MSSPTPPTPEAAVKFARAAAAENRGIGPLVTVGVLTAYDTALADVARLQAIVDGDATIRDLHAYALGRAESDAERPPQIPTPAPPAQGPTRAQEALARVKQAVGDKAFRARKPTDPVGQPATGPIVVPVNAIRAAIINQPAPPDVPAKPLGELNG